MLLLPILLAGLGVATPLGVGDRAVVIKTVALSDGSRTLGELPAGAVLVVGDIDGERVLVNAARPGWVPAASLAPVESAEAAFSAQILAQPRSASLRAARGRVRAAQRRYRDAIDDLNEAIALVNDDPRFYLARGQIHLDLGQLELAKNDINTAIKVDKGLATAYRLRAGICLLQHDYAAALADYNRAIRLAPGDSAVINDRAWMLASCPDEQFRNGRQAVADAWVAASRGGWRMHNRLGTLAAAYAEAGDFDNAVKWQEEAIRLAPRDQQPEYQARLELYRSQRPYREAVW